MATKTKTPIVFAIVGDPIGNGIITSLARPGGRVTGLSMSNSDLESKRIEVLKEAAPSVTRVMILHDRSMGTAGLTQAKDAAKALALEGEVIQRSWPV
jgi:putative ABC transport system substrate-binding protein